MSSESAAHLFVYGTLRQGFSNPGRSLLAEHARFAGQGFLQAKLYDLGKYPGVILSEENTDLVLGDLYLLENAERLLPELDEYEGSEFLRRTVEVRPKKRPPLHAWVYLYDRPVTGLAPVASGDYLEKVR